MAGLIALLSLGASSAAASRAPVVVRLGTPLRASLPVGTEVVCSTPVHELLVHVPRTGENQAQARTQSGTVFNLSVIHVGAETTARCSTSGQPIYQAGATRACLARAGVSTGKQVGFVPPSTTAGSFRASVDANAVSVAFATTDRGAELAITALQRTVPATARAALPNRLRRYDNVVTFWHIPPVSSELSTIVSCLR